MEKRLIKKSGEELSLLGFGLMRLPLKAGSREIDKELALEMVDYAKNRGVNYFDTAYMITKETPKPLPGRRFHGTTGIRINWLPGCP